MSTRSKLVRIQARLLKPVTTLLLFAIVSCALLAPSLTPAQVNNSNPSNPVVKLVEGDTSKDFNITTKDFDLRDWPLVRSGFDISRKDGIPFGELKASDIKVFVDSNPIPIKESDFQNITTTKYLFMLDVSKSMDPDQGEAGPSLNKLEAAKTALLTFIDKMRPGDQAAFATFASRPIPILELTDKKEALRDAVKNLKTQPGGTALYDSIEFAIDKARVNGIRNIVVLSDGADMWFVEHEPQYLAPAEKLARENKIADLARDAKVRIFTVAIGDQNYYVDEKSLDSISRQANGECKSIPLTQLKEEAKEDVDEFNRLVADRMKDTLNLIQLATRHTYALKLDLRPFIKPDEKPQTIRMECKVGQTTLAWAKATLNWSPNSRIPVVEKIDYGNRSLVTIAPPELTTRSLSQIYLALFLTLALLILLQQVGSAVVGRVKVNSEARRVRNAVEIIGAGSSLIGENCPNESRSGRYTFKQGDAILRCPKCNTPHHLDCWVESHCTCMVHDCRRKMVIPPDILHRHGFGEESELRSA